MKKRLTLLPILALSALLLSSCQNKPSASATKETDPMINGFATTYNIKSDKNTAYYKIGSGKVKRAKKEKSKFPVTIRSKFKKQKLTVADNKKMSNPGVVNVPATKSLGKYTSISNKVNSYIDKSASFSDLQHLALDTRSGVTDVAVDPPITIRANTDGGNALGFSINCDLSTSKDPMILNNRIDMYILWLQKAISGNNDSSDIKLINKLGDVPSAYDEHYKKTTVIDGIAYTITVMPNVLVVASIGKK